MKSNPVLEEVWRIKDELAREAGYDLHRLCETHDDGSPDTPIPAGQ